MQGFGERSLFYCWSILGRIFTTLGSTPCEYKFFIYGYKVSKDWSWEPFDWELATVWSFFRHPRELCWCWTQIRASSSSYWGFCSDAQCKWQNGYVADGEQSACLQRILGQLGEAAAPPSDIYPPSKSNRAMHSYIDAFWWGHYIEEESDQDHTDPSCDWERNSQKKKHCNRSRVQFYWEHLHNTVPLECDVGTCLLAENQVKKEVQDQQKSAAGVSYSPFLGIEWRFLLWNAGVHRWKTANDLPCTASSEGRLARPCQGGSVWSPLWALDLWS